MSKLSISEWISLCFPESRAEGKELRIECPSCGPSASGSPNASVNIGKGVWRCMKCSVAGDLVRLIQFIENVKTREQALEIVDLEPLEASRKAPDALDSVKTVISLPKGSIKCSNASGKLGQRMLKYADSRKWNKKVIAKYKLRYCVSGRYAGRILIPFYSRDNELVGYQGRAFIKGKEPKYLGPSVPKTLFNIQRQVERGCVIVHEGPADAMRTGGVALTGTYMTWGQLEELLSLRPKEVIVWLDSDAKEQAVKLAGRLIRHVPKVRVYLDHVAKDAADATDGEVVKVMQVARHIRNWLDLVRMYL